MLHLRIPKINKVMYSILKFKLQFILSFFFSLSFPKSISTAHSLQVSLMEYYGCLKNHEHKPMDRQKYL